MDKKGLVQIQVHIGIAEESQHFSGTFVFCVFVKVKTYLVSCFIALEREREKHARRNARYSKREATRRRTQQTVNDITESWPWLQLWLSRTPAARRPRLPPVVLHPPCDAAPIPDASSLWYRLPPAFSPEVSFTASPSWFHVRHKTTPTALSVCVRACVLVF